MGRPSRFSLELKERAVRMVSWRNGRNRPKPARFWACRMTPSTDWHRGRRLASEVWLLGHRDLVATSDTKYFLINLQKTASLTALMRLAHQRWHIEQQY